VIFSSSIFNCFSFTYFVNDASISGDIFCTGTGNNWNNGQSAPFPKASLSSIWATYGPSGTNVITSGDIIYVDKGTYNDVNLSLNVSGITILGAGPSKTVFDNASASADANRLFDIIANNITIQALYIKGYNRGTGGGSAIQISSATGVVFNNVLAQISGAMNATQKTTYVFADYYAEEGINYYRLSQTDVNGAKRELKTISLNNNCLTGSGLDISSSYNSNNNSINLGYKFDENQLLEATVYNAMGQMEQTSEIFLKASERFTEINLMNSFSNGIYFLKLSNSSILFSDKILISK